MTTQKTKKVSSGTKLAIGVGAVALAAATYYLFGPEGKKNREKLRGWMIKMKGEVVERMEKAKEMSESAYHSIVDAVAKRYKNAGISEPELKGFISDLKGQWQNFAKGTKGNNSNKSTPAKKSARKSKSK